MAATNNRTVWQNMETKLRAMGGVTNVSLDEPRSVAQSGHVAIVPMDGAIPEVVLNSWHERHMVALRRYEQIEQEPQGSAVSRLDAWRAEVLEDIFGDFDLGGTIAYPEAAETEWLYDAEQVTGGNYRTLDILVVYQIHPTGTFSK